MYFSITIGDMNTWDHWHLVPTSRPLVNPPEVKTEYIEIPGANGSLDYTEALTGAPVYKDRTGSWEFYVMNGYQEWHVLYSNIMSYLHGKKHKIVLESDPDYVYEGRLSVNEWASEPERSKITIDYVISPYKKSREGAVVDWRWDDLTCDSDAYTIYYGTFNVDNPNKNNPKWRNIYNPYDDHLIIPITVSAPIHVFHYGVEHDFPVGTTQEALDLYPGDNIMYFTGTGKVTINYKKGDII